MRGWRSGAALKQVDRNARLQHKCATAKQRRVVAGQPTHPAVAVLGTKHAQVQHSVSLDCSTTACGSMQLCQQFELQISMPLPSTSSHRRMVIQGAGFSMDKYTGSNVVSIGPYPCNVINHLTSDTLITCETTPGNFGTYVVTVVVDGAYSASSCCFTYDRTLTPSEQGTPPTWHGHEHHRWAVHHRFCYSLSLLQFAMSKPGRMYLRAHVRPGEPPVTLVSSPVN